MQQSLEQLERDMKAVEFEFEVGPDGFTKLCKRIGDINYKFDEFFLRVNVLKTNPHMKNFYDKLIELERTIKGVQEILAEWSLFQRNWLYLQGVFNKSSISVQLAQEMKQWAVIDSTYKIIIKSFLANPQVYKIHYRENF